MCVLLLSGHILTHADVKIPARGHKVEKKKNTTWKENTYKLLYASLSGPVRAGENGLAKRVWPARPASACSFFKLRLNLMLTHGIPPESRRRYMGSVFVVD